MAAFLHLPTLPAASYAATAAPPARVLAFARPTSERGDRPQVLTAFWSLADDGRPVRAWRFSKPSTPR